MLYNPEAIGIALSSAVILVYVAFWFLSKKYRIFILLALIFFIADTAIFAYLFAMGDIWFQNDLSLFIRLAFIGLIGFYLVTGTIAWLKLRNLTSEDIEAAQQEFTLNAQAKEAKKALDELKDEDK